MPPIHNEKLNFAAQGVVVILVSGMITNALSQEPNVSGFLAALGSLATVSDYWLVVVVPILFSPFYFYAAIARSESQSIGRVIILYSVSLLFGLFCTLKAMPLVGIYLVATTIGFFLYGYRANYS